MEFFSVLNDIRKNNNNFKKWDNAEKDNDARRKALYENGIGKNRFEKAKAKGDVVIDVITKMDQHSENVSEDIETAAQQVFGLGSLLVSLLGFGIGVGSILKHEKKWNEEREDFIKNNKEFKNLGMRDSQAAYQTYISQELNPNKSNYKDVVSVLDDKEWKTARKEKQKQLKQIINKKCGSKTGAKAKGYALAIGISFVAEIINEILTLNWQMLGSRIARWQSRENMRDERNFVCYTDEQIAQAKENLKNKPTKKKSFFDFSKKDKGIEDRGFFSNMANIWADKPKYEKWKAEYNDKKNLVTRELSAEEIAQAKSDQQMIQRIVKKINNKAEEYSENMETASYTIIGSSYLGGYVLQKATNWFLDKTKLLVPVVEYARKDFSKEALERIKKVEARKNPGIFGAIEILGHSIDGCFEKKESTFKKGLNVFLSTTKGGNISGFIVAIAGAIISLQLQKSAARAGRFNARQDFKENPQEYISYTEEEMQSVQNIKNPKESLGQKFKNYMLFVPRCIGQMRKYEKYKKTELEQEKQLNEELKKIKVSEEQLKEARNIQKMLFTTFEKVDEKSQLYSETMEAANEMAEETSQTFGPILAIATPIGLAAWGINKGKLNVVNISEIGLKIFNKFSWLGKRNFVKNAFNDFGDRLTDIIKTKSLFRNNITKSNVQEEISKEMFLSNYKDNILEMLKELKKNKSLQDEIIAKCPKDKTFFEFLQMGKIDREYIKRNIPRVENIIKSIPSEEIDNLVRRIEKAHLENPDVQLNYDDISSAFFETPFIANLILGGTITYGVLQLTLLFTIASIFAQLELKAGKLGVMKSLEDLQDYRYYAPMEQTKNNSSQKIDNPIIQKLLAK